MKTQVIDPAYLVGVMEDATARYVVSTERRPKSEDSTPFIPSNVWAGQYSTCARQLTLRMTKSHELPEFDAERLARFRRGKDRARNIKADLEQAGRDARPPFELLGHEQRFVLEWDGRAVITGKVDWKTKFDSIPAIPTELKSWSTTLTDRVNSFEDLMDNRWTRKGAMQLLCYMWGSNSELGLFVLDRPGLPRFLPVSLFADENKNLLRVEAFLKLSAEAVLYKESDELPPYTTDVNECKACDFLGTHCTPPTLAGAGMQLIADETLAAYLDRRAELLEAHKEFERLDDSIKKQLRGVELAVIGDWLVEGKWQKQTKHLVPKDQQKLYDSWARVDPKGKFVMKFYSTKAKPDKEGEGDE